MMYYDEPERSLRWVTQNIKSQEEIAKVATEKLWRVKDKIKMTLTTTAVLNFRNIIGLRS